MKQIDHANLLCEAAMPNHYAKPLHHRLQALCVKKPITIDDTLVAQKHHAFFNNLISNLILIVSDEYQLGGLLDSAAAYVFGC